MKIFIANWKMQLSIKEGVNLAKKIKEKLETKNKLAKVVLCPSFDSLGFVAKAIRSNQKSRIFLGAQDVFWEERGAYTGEVSVLNLKEIGCGYVILGHSERRKLGETDEEVRKKVMAVLKAGLIPIICIGETLLERKEGKTKDVIRKQLAAIFDGLKLKIKNQIIIAYEPVWAIGTGVYANPKDVGIARDLIFKFLQNYFNENQLKKIFIIYGGSVDSKNIYEFLTVGKMEGALVGGASLNTNEFLKIIQYV